MPASTSAPAPASAPERRSRPRRSIAPSAAPTLLLTAVLTTGIALGGCGNRGELYLESSGDPALELGGGGENDPLGDPVPPGSVSDVAPASGPASLPRGETIAPVPSPDIGAPPVPDEDEEGEEGAS